MCGLFIPGYSIAESYSVRTRFGRVIIRRISYHKKQTASSFKDYIIFLFGCWIRSHEQTEKQIEVLVRHDVSGLKKESAKYGDI